MNAIHFLTEWAVRSSLLISFAGSALWALRVKDSSIRLAAWTAVLAGSLLVPVMKRFAADCPGACDAGCSGNYPNSRRTGCAIIHADCLSAGPALTAVRLDESCVPSVCRDRARDAGTT